MSMKSAMCKPEWSHGCGCNSEASSEQGSILLDAEGSVVSVSPNLHSLLELPDIILWSMPKSEIQALLSLGIPGLTGEFTPLLDQEGKLVQELFTIRRTLQDQDTSNEKLRYLAYHDPLTDLPNRMCFHRCLNRVIKKAEARRGIAAVLFLDLDRFKSINDTLGHAVGDLLLQEVSDRLKDCLHREDYLSRMGGDEFTCVLSNIRDQAEAEQAAGHMIASLSKPFILQGKEYTVTTSIGISLYPYHGDDVETLLTNADTAMYRAKENGRNGYKFYSHEMNAVSFEKLLLEQSLGKAIGQEELRLYYQPQVDIATGEVVGLEALVRWQHPEFGLIPPSEFVPIAEESGLIVDLGRWVLLAACRQAMEWRQLGLPPVKMSVNVSAKQFFRDEFTTELLSILKETGMAPDGLELELTETALIQDVQQTIDKLIRIRALGVKIALDDFGTGYSSLLYLKRFPLDVIKIDRVFIRDIAENANDQAIAQAVIRMAHDLNLKVVAEGIETKEQLDQIRKPHCDIMQGYLFSRPVPPEEILRLLPQG